MEIACCTQTQSAHYVGFQQQICNMGLSLCVLSTLNLTHLNRTGHFSLAIRLKPWSGEHTNCGYMRNACCTTERWEGEWKVTTAIRRNEEINTNEWNENFNNGKYVAVMVCVRRTKQITHEFDLFFRSFVSHSFFEKHSIFFFQNVEFAVLDLAVYP